MGPSEKGRRKPTKSPANASSGSAVFTEEERTAMLDRAREVRTERRKSADPVADGEAAVIEKLGQMPEPDRSLGRSLHETVRTSAPGLVPRLWYGMPAYSKDGEVLCWFQPASKFKARYAMLGFSDEANLDEGEMWATAYAVKAMSAAERARISALLKRAVG